MTVDGSDTSRYALQQAIELARNWSATLRIVDVVVMRWLPIGPEMAIETAAISADRRAAGEEIITTARETAQQARFEAEAARMETETLTQGLQKRLPRKPRTGRQIGWCREPTVTVGFSALCQAAWPNKWHGNLLGPSCSFLRPSFRHQADRPLP